MKHHNQRIKAFPLLLLFVIFIDFFTPLPVLGAVKTTDLESAAWNTITELSIIDENGWLQSMCATDQYIVCLIDGDKKTTVPDTLIAFYRNQTDAQGNPVKQYSYAFHVTETDYEHGNGMTYNPNTQEIAIAGLFTNDASNAGAVFIVDANTLKFKRKVQVGNGSWNYFGIDYVPEKDQYVLMANRIADYSFVFTDGNFQITDVMNLGLSSSRSSFQDFCVTGDSIISIPYMQRDGFMNIVDVYSISQKQRVGSYYLALPDNAFSVEPEGICQLEPGHFLMASAVKGTTVFKLYETHLPIVHSIVTNSENGTITESSLEVPAGGSYTVQYSSEENFRLQKLIVDGQEQNVQDFPTEYTFTDIQNDHTIETYYEEIPRYAVTTSAEHGTVDESPSAFEHDPLTINFSPAEHYELDALTVDGVSIPLDGNETSYTFEGLSADHTLEVVFKPIPSYTVQVQAENGLVQEEKATVYRDEAYTTKVKPEGLYTLTRCLVDGADVPFKDEDNFTLLNIQSNHTITLIYSKGWLPYLIQGCVWTIVLILGILFVRSERLRRHRQRRKELRHIRWESREFFDMLEELEEMQKHPEETGMTENELEDLMDEIRALDTVSHSAKQPGKNKKPKQIP